MQPWTPQHGPLLERPSTGGRWIFPGRRLLVGGSWAGGIEEVWAHPWRIAQRFRLSVEDAVPVTALAARSPALVERSLGVPGGTAREHCVVSAMHGLCIWELVAAPSSIVEVAWDADATLAGEARAPLRIERSADAVLLERAGGPRYEVRLLAGESIVAEAAPGAAALRARGRGAVRLAFVAGADAADLSRPAERLDRRGPAAVADERTQHARLIADYATSLEAPDAAEVDRFEWAKHAADALLVELPGGLRALAAGYRDPGGAEWQRHGPIVWAGPAALGPLADALLAAGIREPVRDAARRAPHPAVRAALAAPLRAWSGDVPPAAAASQGAESPGAGDGTAGPPPWQPLADELFGRWGLSADAGRSLAIAPSLGDRRSMALRRVRVGPSVVDLELSRRFDRVTARLHRRHGGGLPVALELRDAEPIAVTADDQPLPPGRVVVPVTDRHEVLFQL